MLLPEQSDLATPSELIIATGGGHEKTGHIVQLDFSQPRNVVSYELFDCLIWGHRTNLAWLS